MRSNEGVKDVALVGYGQDNFWLGSYIGALFFNADNDAVLDS